MNATPTAREEREAYGRVVELLRPLRRERERQQVTDAGADAQALDAIADLLRASEPVLGLEEDITALVHRTGRFGRDRDAHPVTDAEALNALAHIFRGLEIETSREQDIRSLIAGTGRDLAPHPGDLPTYIRFE